MNATWRSPASLWQSESELCSIVILLKVTTNHSRLILLNPSRIMWSASPPLVSSQILYYIALHAFWDMKDIYGLYVRIISVGFCRGWRGLHEWRLLGWSKKVAPLLSWRPSKKGMSRNGVLDRVLILDWTLPSVRLYCVSGRLSLASSLGKAKHTSTLPNARHVRHFYGTGRRGECSQVF